jgi:hypothetical protein
VPERDYPGVTRSLNPEGDLVLTWFALAMGEFVVTIGRLKHGANEFCVVSNR